MTNDKYKEMYLVMIAGDFPPRISGVGDYAFHISSTAAKMGVNVIVICTKNERTRSLQLYGSIDARPVMDKWRFSEIKNIFQVLHESGGNTIVNIQYGCLAYGRRLMINFLPFIIRLLFPQVKIVITLHGFWEQSVLFQLRALPMLRFAHGIIYVDRLNRKLIKKYSGFSEERMKFIPIAGNIPPIPCMQEQRIVWRKDLGFSKDDVVVAFFGGIGRNKGFEYLLEAVARARKLHTASLFLLAIGGFHTYLMGEGYKKKISDLITKLGLSKNFIVFENVNSIDVSIYLHASDIAIFPFLDGVGENSGSMLAALAHGLPTIITKGSANDDTFTERFGVMMVPPKDSKSLADAIVKIITSAELQKHLSDKAIKVSEKLNWDFVTQETLNFFSSFP